MDYSVYETADFVYDDSFVAWVKYGEAASFWENVEKQYPEKREMMLQAKAIITTAGSLPVFPYEEQVNEQVWNNIRHSMHKRPFIRWYWAAAAIAAIIVVGFLLLPVQKHKKDLAYRQLLRQVKNENPVETVNQGTSPLAVSLPDGSSVLLQPGARLSYPACFGKNCNRRVFLSGAAFFEIWRDAKTPFVVYANEMIIDVLGTSFGVRAYDEDSLVQLIVKSGKVSVSVQSLRERQVPDSAKQQMIITPSQQATLRRNTLLLDVVPVQLHKQQRVLPTIIEPDSFVFNDTPVDSVMQAIEKAYGVHISYDKTLMADCKLTASLNDEPLHEKIRLICKALEANCTIEGNEIKISARGCQNRY